MRGLTISGAADSMRRNATCRRAERRAFITLTPSRLRDAELRVLQEALASIIARLVFCID